MKKLLLLLSIAFLMSCEQAIITTTPEPDINYTTMFRVNGGLSETTTILEYNSPILSINDDDYNVRSEYTDLDVYYSGSYRIVDLFISLDKYSSYYFQSDNMIVQKDIDNLWMTEAEFMEMITFIYAPSYSETVYSLSEYQDGTPDTISVSTNYIYLNGVMSTDDDFPITYYDDIKKVSISIYIDSDDYFLFVSNNMYDYIGIDFHNMTREEFIIAADVLTRYPAESIWDLQEEYNPL